MTLAVLLVVLAGALTWVVRPLSPFIISIIWMVPIVAAMTPTEQIIRSPKYGSAFLVICVGILLGYWMVALGLGHGNIIALSTTNESSPGGSYSSTEAGKRDTRAIGVMLALTAFLCAYHYAKVGIPFFKSNVELERWNFTGSGLFGAPGRALTTGLPVIYVLAALNAHRVGHDIPRARQLVRIALVIFVFFGLLSGFKGSLIRVALPVLFTNLILTQRYIVTAQALRILRRMMLPVLVAATVAIAVGSTYGSYQVSDQSTIERLLERASTDVADTALFTMSLRDEAAFDWSGSTYAHDLRILVGSYVRGQSASDPVFNRYLSAFRSGRDIQSDFITPVTPTGPAVFYFNFGLLGGAAAGAVLGGSYRLVEQMARNSSTICRQTGGIIGLLWLHALVASGGAVFGFINWAVVAVAYFLGFRILRIPTSPPHRGRIPISTVVNA